MYIKYFFALLTFHSIFTAPKRHQKPVPKHESTELLEDLLTPRDTAIGINEEEAKKIENVSSTAARLENDETLTKKIEALEELRKAGWDSCTDNEPIILKPLAFPTLLSRITAIPKEWWNTYIDEPNRIEHALRYIGTRTYTILLAKLARGEFDVFIQDLNHANADEGHRWIDESLNQAVKDEKESIVRKIMKSAIRYKKALPATTRSNISTFLNVCAEKKRKAHIADSEDYAQDMTSLAEIIREADIEEPKHPEITIESIETCTQSAVNAVTQHATGGYLPRRSS